MFKHQNAFKALLLVLYLTPSMVIADTKFSFRGVELGMSSSQINSLESVKEGYMPRVELLPNGAAKNAAICMPAFVVVVFEGSKHSYQLRSSPAPKDGMIGDERNRSSMRSDTVICKTKNTQNYKNAVFEVEMVFWDGVLQQLEIQYGTSDRMRGSLKNFHEALMKKFVENDEVEVLSDGVEDNRKWYYVTPGGTGFSRVGHANFNSKAQPTAIVDIKHKHKISLLNKFFIDNYPQFVRLTIGPYGFWQTVKEHGKKEFKDYVDSLAAEEEALRIEAREKLRKKQELDKKFMN